MIQKKENLNNKEQYFFNKKIRADVWCVHVLNFHRRNEEIVGKNQVEKFQRVSAYFEKKQ